MSPAPAKTHSTPPGVISLYDLPVTTGDVDLYVFAASTITVPTPQTTPDPVTISYLSLPFTVLPDSRLAFASTTLAPNAPGQVIPGGEDYLPQSVSYGDGKLVLGQKTSTDTYPPQALETANGLAVATKTAATVEANDATTSQFPDKQVASGTTSIEATIEVQQASQTLVPSSGNGLSTAPTLLPSSTSDETTLSTRASSLSTGAATNTMATFGPFLKANTTNPFASGSAIGSGSGTGVLPGSTGPAIIATGGSGRAEVSGILGLLYMAVVMTMLWRS